LLIGSEQRNNYVASFMNKMDLVDAIFLSLLPVHRADIQWNLT